MNAPRSLQTERLDLQWLTPGDAPLMLAIWTDPAFVRHVGDRGVRTLEEARDALGEGPLKLYEDYGYGPYRVTLREDGAAMGICGLFRRDGLDDPDIGFALLPEYCRAGYAYESAAAVFAVARDELALPRLTAIVSPANAASIGLIEKLGMHYERPMRLPGDDHDVSLYGVDFGAS